MDYKFTVEYIPESHNKAADSLSRHPVDSQMKATKHMVKYKLFSFECATYHRLKRPIAPFDSNVSETQPKMIKIPIIKNPSSARFS